MLPLDQLADVLSSKNKTDLFIGGVVDQHTGTITLARGDLTSMNVPLSIFADRGAVQIWILVALRWTTMDTRFVLAGMRRRHILCYTRLIRPIVAEQIKGA